MAIVDKHDDTGSSLGEREAEVMGVLWNVGSGTVGEVRAGLSDDLAYTTVLTILRNLEKKGFLSHQTEGRAHRYAPRIGRQAATRDAIDRLLSTYFKSSAEELLRYMAEDGMVGRKTLKRVRSGIEKKGSGRSKKGRRKKQEAKTKAEALRLAGAVERDDSGRELPAVDAGGKVVSPVMLDDQNAGKTAPLPDSDKTIQHP